MSFKISHDEGKDWEDIPDVATKGCKMTLFHKVSF